MNKTNWQIKDIIDLRYYIQQDEEDDEDTIQKRDRLIYLDYIKPLESDSQLLARGRILKEWLERRRELESRENNENNISPGALFEEICHLLKYSFLIIGLIIGSGMAFSYLIYKGVEPLNVFVFIVTFVVVQIALLLLIIVFSVMRKLSHKPSNSTIVAVSLSRLIANLIVKIKESGSKKLTGTMRRKLESAYGIIQKERKSYGSLFSWPFFLLAQWFMVAFNIGVVLAFLLKVMVSDIAFGWQSTLFSAEWVSDLVQAISIPWSWFISPESAYPSLSQIAGSQMILKEGIHHMATSDMTSWWPFLSLTVIFYGLLPRLILIAVGFLWQKKKLDRIDFNQSIFETLFHRLNSPIVRIEGNPVEKSIPGDRIPKPLQPDQRDPSTSLQHGNYVALIPDDIRTIFPGDTVQNLASRITGNSIERHFKIDDDTEQDRKVLKDIFQLNKNNGALNILLIRWAWDPLIKEDLSFIGELRKILAPPSKIKIGLMGKPDKGKDHTLVKEEDWRARNQELNVLGDPYLSAERLVSIDG